MRALPVLLLLTLPLAGCLEAGEPAAGCTEDGVACDDTPGAGGNPTPEPTPTTPAGSTPPATTPSTATNVSFRTLAEGQQSGHEGAVRDVLGTAEEWAAFWEVHGQGQLPPPERPEVDFESERVVAVVLPTKSSGGYGVRVTEVRDEGEGIVVHVVTYEPEAGGGVTMALTNPFHFVAIPQGAEDVRFEESTQTGAPPASAS